MPSRVLPLEITEPDGERADHALLRHLSPALSRRQLKESFHRGDVRLHGRPIQAHRMLGPGKVEIEIVLAAPTIARPSARGSFLPIVFEDDRLLVLHKLSGVPSLPHYPEESDNSAVGAALAHTPTLPAQTDRGLEPGLLHRLDTSTSGLLVFAKTEAEWKRLRGLWRNGGVQKFYRACVAGTPSAKAPSAQKIETPLGHDAKSAKRMLALPSKRAFRGKPLPARTEILEVAPLSSHQFDLHIRIETGVMHQIRCHLSSIGWPILGDPIYGGGPAPRLWLHAWRIALPLASGATLALEAELPEGWPA